MWHNASAYELVYGLRPESACPLAWTSHGSCVRVTRRPRRIAVSMSSPGLMGRLVWRNFAETQRTWARGHRPAITRAANTRPWTPRELPLGRRYRGSPVFWPSGETVGPYNRPLQPTAVTSHDQTTADGAVAERPHRSPHRRNDSPAGGCGHTVGHDHDRSENEAGVELHAATDHGLASLALGR